MDSSELTTTKAPGVYSEPVWSTGSIQFSGVKAGGGTITGHPKGEYTGDDLETWPSLVPGTRVHIVGNPVALTLSSPYGYVVRPDEYDEDHYVVRLEMPATYHHADGRIEQLHEIVQAVFNLEAIPSVVRARELGT